MRYQGGLFLMTVANGVSSGGGFRLTPRASLTDGYLDVCIVEELSFYRILQLLPLALTGRHESAPEVHTARATRMACEPETPVFVHADGEVVTRSARRIEVEVMPGALSVLRPRNFLKRSTGA